MNKAIISGNLGRDPELRFTQSGTAVCKFSVATTKRGKNGRSETTWHNIVVWGKPAEVAAKYLHKGRKVLLEGEMVHGEYTTKEGVKKQTFEIHTWNHVEFMGEQASAPGDGYGDFGGVEKDSPEPAMTPSLDDIPF